MVESLKNWLIRPSKGGFDSSSADKVLAWDIIFSSGGGGGGGGGAKSASDDNFCLKL